MKYHRCANNKVSGSVFAHIKSLDLDQLFSLHPITLHVSFATFTRCPVFIMTQLCCLSRLRAPGQCLIHHNSPAPRLVSDNTYFWITNIC